MDLTKGNVRQETPVIFHVTECQPYIPEMGVTR